ITSTAAPEPLVRAADVREALHVRRARPLFFVDIAVPRNVEPAVNQLPNAFCYDVDDLRSVVEANLRERQREAQRALALVDREVERFAARVRDLEVVPTIVSLREKLEAIRCAELAKALGRLPGADEETRRVIEALSQAIVNKVLHAPTVKLRDSSRAGHGHRFIELVTEIFGLKGSARPPGRGERGAWAGAWPRAAAGWPWPGPIRWPPRCGRSASRSRSSPSGPPVTASPRWPSRSSVARRSSSRRSRTGSSTSASTSRCTASRTCRPSCPPGSCWEP